MPKLSLKPLPAAIALIGLAAMAGVTTAADLDSPVEEITYGGWYVRGDLGVAFSDADGEPRTEDAFAVGVGLGYRINELFRADVTFDTALDYDFGPALGSNVDAYSLTGNLYFDLPITLIFQPYVGGGVGWGEVDGGAFDDDGVALAGMAGLTYELPSNGALDVGYRVRYIDISTATSDYWLDHSLRVGFRFGF